MRRSASTSGSAPRPDIIVDFNCEQGMLFVSLKNIGLRSAYNVCTNFDKPLLGLSGDKCISELQLFRCVEFIPPGKEFSQLIDPVSVWFRQSRPNRYTINISYSDREGKQFKECIVHDLSIYKDLGYVRVLRSGGIDDKPTS